MSTWTSVVEAPADDRDRCAPIVRDSGEHPPGRLRLPRRGVHPRGLEPEPRPLGIGAPFGHQLERAPLGDPRLPAGLSAKLVEQPAEGVERRRPILGEGRLQRLERALRIAPAGAEIGLQPLGDGVVLTLELAHEPGPDRVGRLAQRGRGGGAIPREPADGRQPLPEGAFEIAVGDGELGQLRR